MENISKEHLSLTDSDSLVDIDEFSIIVNNNDDNDNLEDEDPLSDYRSLTTDTLHLFLAFLMPILRFWILPQVKGNNQFLFLKMNIVRSKLFRGYIQQESLDIVLLSQFHSLFQNILTNVY